LDAQVLFFGASRGFARLREKKKLRFRSCKTSR
jgi:hypothetical protein